MASLIEDQAATIGEKIELRRLVRLSGDHYAVYLHRTSKDLPPQIGVVLAYSGDDAETARSIAQHISFADPVYLSRDDVPPAEVENERRIVETISREEGKPEAALPKIVEVQESISTRLASHDKRAAETKERIDRVAEDMERLRATALQMCEGIEPICQKLGCWAEVQEYVAQARETIARVRQEQREH